NSITLIGEPRQVEIATSLLTQLDARRRQVAVNVKIVDIDLNNTQDYNSSFSFGYEDSYFVQDRGTAVMRFGQTAPLSSDNLRSAIGGVTNPPLITNPVTNSSVFLDVNNPIIIPGITPGSTDSVFFPSVAAISTNPFATGLTNFASAQLFTDPATGVQTYTPATTTYGLPSYFQYPKRFQAQVEAQVRSGNAKVLTDPTLVVQEGQQATVKLTQKVVESVNTQVDPLSGVRTTTPVLADAGLTVTISVDQIDDNGFIGLSVSPTIAAPGERVTFESGPGSSNELTLLNRRELTSGLIRLRDGQTLILTGIITQQDRSTTSKVPILGDLPVIGALFRSQSDETQRSEVVVMLTPQIMSDSTEAQFGYNYTPGKATADYLRQQGFPVQAQP
ncbi:MAG: type II secretion system protein GspD, partial [Microcystaceae cyanobacterium]